MGISDSQLLALLENDDSVASANTHSESAKNLFSFSPQQPISDHLPRIRSEIGRLRLENCSHTKSLEGQSPNQNQKILIKEYKSQEPCYFLSHRLKMNGDESGGSINIEDKNEIKKYLINEVLGQHHNKPKAAYIKLYLDNRKKNYKIYYITQNQENAECCELGKPKFGSKPIKIEMNSRLTKDELIYLNNRYRQAKEIVPIDPNEVLIQAYRYLQGILLICEGLEPCILEPCIIPVFKSPESSDSSSSVENETSISEKEVSSRDNISSELSIQQYFEAFRQSWSIDDSYPSQKKALTELANNFAEMLYQAGIAKNRASAHKQLTTARDLGTMLEAHSPVCTIVREKEVSSLEYSELVQVPESFYDDYEKQSWYQSLKKKIGIVGDNFSNETSSIDSKDWLTNFFQQHISEIKKYGVPAAPSSRGLPQPGNAQNVTMLAKREEVINQLNLIRLAITVPFESTDLNDAQQLKIAKDQIKAIIDSQKEKYYTRYKELYNPLYRNESDPDKVDGNSLEASFFINYQTLLSPIWGASWLYWLFPDNNEKFVLVVKKALEELEKEPKVKMLHTNFAINWYADWTYTFDQDEVNREEKLKQTADTITKYVSKYLPNQVNDSNKVMSFIRGKKISSKLVESYINCVEELATSIEANVGVGQSLQAAQSDNSMLHAEIALRLRSSFYLRLLEDGYKIAYSRGQLNDRLKPVATHAYNNSSFSVFEDMLSLSTFQRNIMMAALGACSMGSAQLLMSGCKSACDREAIFLAAVHTMLQNPQAMSSWRVLNDGIIKKLKEGHCYFSLIHYVAIVKINDVHNYFMEQLPDMMQSAINALLSFRKELPGQSWLSRMWNNFFGAKKNIAKESNELSSDELPPDSTLIVGSEIGLSSVNLQLELPTSSVSSVSSANTSQIPPPSQTSSPSPSLTPGY